MERISRVFSPVPAMISASMKPLRRRFSTSFSVSLSFPVLLTSVT
jgi:hypothetical protein